MSPVTEHIAPHVSVVVPSYNHERFIEETLRSVFAQRWRPMDLLVIDDGSRDGSQGVIERVLRDAPFPARLIARENKGLTRTLNEGLAQAKGRYFAYLGSDDLWEPMRLTRGVEALERDSAAVMAFSHCYFIDAQSRRVDVTSRSRTFESGYYLWQMLNGIVGIMSPTPLFRTDALKSVGWNEEARLEDFELYLGLSLLGPFAFVDEALGSWRVHETNTSKSWEFMVRERIATVERMARKLGLSEVEVERLRTRIRFEEAGGLLAAGHRFRASFETLRSLGGARSTTELTSRFVQLALPRPLLELRRRVVERRMLRH